MSTDLLIAAAIGFVAIFPSSLSRSSNITYYASTNVFVEMVNVHVIYLRHVVWALALAVFLVRWIISP